MTEPNLDPALEKLYGKPVPSAEVIKLRGDASSRSYFRVRVAAAPAGSPASVIAMLLPGDAFGSDEGGRQPDSVRLPFLEVAELLDSKGLPVPAIYVEDLERRIILLEDLGDVTFEQRLRQSPPGDREKLYGSAVDLLVDLHERCDELPAGSVVSKRAFDRDLLDWELEHFREWGLEALFGALDAAQTETLREAFGRIVRAIEGMPTGFVHRDYQSKNLMVAPDDTLTLIDFQDALRGPRVYDLVALLCDSYVSLDQALQESMIERYAALRRMDASTVRREFWCVALHRKLKDAGRFIYIDRVRRNPDFLQWYPQSLVYVGRAAAQIGGFEGLEGLLRSSIPGFPSAVEIPAPSAE